MPMDLVGKTHRTIFIEGVHWADHEDMGKFFGTKCGKIEAMESINDRLWIVFEQPLFVEIAKKFEGMTFKMPENKVQVRSADEKKKLGKSVLSRFSTDATVAPRSEVVSSAPTSTNPFSNLAGLLGPSQGSAAPSSVKDAANQEAQSKKAFLSALTNKDSLKLMLGGPSGSATGASFDGPAQPTATAAAAAHVRSLLDEAEADMKDDIKNNVTIKTSTDNVLPTVAGQVVIGDPQATVGNNSIPSNMRLADVDDFMNEHLRRQCEALIKLGKNVFEKELLSEIAILKRKVSKRKEKRERED
eukprot:GILI01029091.1.p1 GENE.GILI01029091.1~~GILI01029091.1.p1  ORF type:complete len:301 (+),score=33.60 GILI01029091.1:48-950(+)